MLVDREAQSDEKISASIARSARIGPYRASRLVRGGLSTTLYLVEDDRGKTSLLKMSNTGYEEFVAEQLDREAQALQRLGGTVAPAFLERGKFGQTPFLRREWLDGTESHAFAAKLRLEGRDTRVDLLELAQFIARAYAQIHRAGIVHGDVHPGNVLVLPSREVRILDFGQRGDLPFFFEPECARALRQGGSAPPATARGEQYALAAMLYVLLTGQNYIDFRADRETALAQILGEAPRAFSDLELVPWPEVEAILRKALAKDPAARYPSIQNFAEALQAAASPAVLHEFSVVRDDAFDDAFAELKNPDLSLEAPSASVGYGGAGIAYLLRRAACLMERPDLLAAAELWLDRAWKESPKPRGLLSEKHRISDRVATPSSLYYGAAGIHVVAALVGETAGDIRPLARAMDYFTSLGKATHSADATSGLASALLGCALLVELHPAADSIEIADLMATGHRFCEDLVLRIDELQYFGAAHGRAGALQAILRWHGSLGTAPPAAIVDRLHELASLAVHDEKGASWSISRSDARRPGGWCNGAAGYVSLWATAYRVLRDDRYSTLALQSAAHVSERLQRSIGQLCCGLAGQGESLLIAYQLTGDRRWIGRARECAQSIDRDALLPHSLLRGRLGAALLDLDIVAPQTAGMPFFDRERL